MAHNAETSNLIDQLIKIVIKNLSEADVEHHKRLALRTLANNHSARTNQFEVTARLDGLEEKWRIVNNDPLADALHLRRAELSVASNSWIPEILSLLLQISDRPVDHTNLADLALLKPELPSTQLTWADLVAEDPRDDWDGIWKNVDFTADDSDDDERTESVHSDHSVLTPESTVIEPAGEACIKPLIAPATIISLREIQNAQFWNMQDADKSDLIRDEDEDRGPKTNLTEIQAIREVVFLLLGLPTSIFSHGNQGQIIVSKADFLEHVSQESLTGLLKGFAVIANKLLRIRQWAERDEQIPLEQTFQTALASRLATVDRALSGIQTKILSRDTLSVPSLLNLYDEIYNMSRLLLQVYDVLLELDVSPKLERPFRILEYLFDRTCVNQGIGDAEGYEYMANLFFACFQTYLKPIRLWMEQGLLTGRDRVIFIEKDEKNVPLISDQYHLKKDSSGGLRAPKFLHGAAKKIFNTGKSIEFLRRLGREDHELRRDPAKEIVMTYESICQLADVGLFGPFSELFDMALDTWIANKHQASSSELRAQLDSRCGLQASLDALEYIYFGPVSTNVSNRIFEKIDRGNHRWNDDLIMTELFQSASNSTGRLEIRLSPAAQKESSRARRSMSVLEDIRVSYTLSWPIANVVGTESTALYQRVFVFLTQLQRAKYLIQRHRIPKSVQATDQKLHLQICTPRHRLLWFTNTILTYITDMVLSVATADMRIAMDQAKDVDVMITVHQAYIKRLEDQCLLLEKHTSVRQAIISLLDLTVLVSDVQASYQVSSNSESSFTDTESNHKHATYSKQEKAARAASDEDEDSDSDSDDSRPRPALHTQLPDAGRLKKMLDTFRNLHNFVTAAVRGISKADSAPSWEILANNLAMGLEK
ncbi:MAG: hypothetical protein Q9175_000578 [Cornicularia normoerica]